ncbi:hypothetical protein EDD16DRAFT_1838308 [Pisolithus croceorrhizus]|nr:hypothetical protein EDD16DRAFT_1838308 [Pisolithus croceorrhizus]
MYDRSCRLIVLTGCFRTKALQRCGVTIIPLEQILKTIVSSESLPIQSKHLADTLEHGLANITTSRLVILINASISRVQDRNDVQCFIILWQEPVINAHRQSPERYQVRLR